MIAIDRIETVFVDMPTIPSHVPAMGIMNRQMLCPIQVFCSYGIAGLGEATQIGGLSYGSESPESIKPTIDTYTALLLTGADRSRPAVITALLSNAGKRTRGRTLATTG